MMNLVVGFNLLNQVSLFTPTLSNSKYPLCKPNKPLKRRRTMLNNKTGTEHKNQRQHIDSPSIYSLRAFLHLRSSFTCFLSCLSFFRSRSDNCVSFRIIQERHFRLRISTIRKARLYMLFLHHWHNHNFKDISGL